MTLGAGDAHVFHNPADFGSQVVVGAQTGVGRFRVQLLMVNDGGGLPVESARPTLEVIVGSFEQPAQDASVYVAGVEYAYRGKADKAGSGLFETWVLAEVTS